MHPDRRNKSRSWTEGYRLALARGACDECPYEGARAADWKVGYAQGQRDEANARRAFEKALARTREPPAIRHVEVHHGGKRYLVNVFGNGVVFAHLARGVYEEVRGSGQFRRLEKTPRLCSVLQCLALEKVLGTDRVASYAPAESSEDRPRAFSYPQTVFFRLDTRAGPTGIWKNSNSLAPRSRKA